MLQATMQYNLVVLLPHPVRFRKCRKEQGRSRQILEPQADKHERIDRSRRQLCATMRTSSLLHSTWLIETLVLERFSCRISPISCLQKQPLLTVVQILLRTSTKLRRALVEVVLLLLLAQAASSAQDPLPISLVSSQLISEWIANSSISLQLLTTLCKLNPQVKTR